MQFNAPVEIPDEITREAAIFGSWQKAPLEIKADAEDERRKDECSDYLAEMIPHDSRVEEVESERRAEEKNVSDDPGRNPIEFVARAIARWSDGSFKGLSREPLEEHQLNSEKEEHDHNGVLTWPGPVHNHRAPASDGDQRQHRSFERLESADDPENDRCGRREENQEQWSQSGAQDLNDRVLAAGCPGSKLLGGR